ncbi:hypothetical protein HHL26_06545 [Sphingobium sp. TB-6]|uniref:hypothetical protein n=1 Tax=Sphingobium sp. TB-6 TaxID=2728850 RepID=UPI00146EC0A8|nr:hypothetical protein [Sphingobium sp. TB-6]NML88725.1 hypothetical protein [Sphingobium sp. TB-6]
MMGNLPVQAGARLAIQPAGEDAADRKAAWALCRHESCGHRWVVVYLPMDLIKAATAMKRATCPMCGDTRPFAYAPPVDKSAEPEIGCDYCRNDGPLVHGGTPRCPRCDAEYPEEDGADA